MRSGGQWIGILAFALAACESSAFERVVNCPACGQGEIRYAARVETLDHIWITARDDGGLAVLADNQVRILDHKLVQLSSQEVLGYGSLGGDGESIYVAQRIERDDAPITRLSKIGRDGEIVWRQVLDLESINGVDANSQIVYVSASTVTPPYSPVLEVFSAIDGSPLRRAGSGQSFRAVTDGDVSVSNDAIRASVITKRTVAGTEQWSRSVVAAEGGEVGLFVSGIAVDASVTLIGGFTGGSVMIGDQVVAMPAGAESASLVVDLDANGVFGSAVAIANTTIAFAHATSGEMIIAGVYQGSALGLPEANDQDAFVAIASAGEVGRAYALGGPGAQELTGLARSNDGVIWLAMRNDYSLETDRSEAPSFRIGSRSFDGPDAFVLGFVY